MYLQKSFFVFLFCLAACQISAQNEAAKVVVPDWALPGSATHKQVPPPADFHRATRTENIPIGIFQGQSDVGAALVLWKKMSGDVSLAADINFPDTAGYDDRKAFVIIRQSLDDDSKEAVVAVHGGGLLHLAWRPEKGQQMKEVRANNRKGLPDLVSPHVGRIGIEKRGDAFVLFVSNNGEPMHQVGDPIQLHIDGPFFAGIGFCSHLPAKTDTAIFSNVVLVNQAGKL
jgi:hypothetical protein